MKYNEKVQLHRFLDEQRDTLAYELKKFEKENSLSNDEFKNIYDEVREFFDLKIEQFCLPEYLIHDINEYEKHKDDKSCTFIDCLQDEIQGSINMALINDRIISEEYAQHLRKKYLYK